MEANFCNEIAYHKIYMTYKLVKSQKTSASSGEFFFSQALKTTLIWSPILKKPYGKFSTPMSYYAYQPVDVISISLMGERRVHEREST